MMKRNMAPRVENSTNRGRYQRQKYETAVSGWEVKMFKALVTGKACVNRKRSRFTMVNSKLQFP